jgi:hypothetical protein
MGHACYFLIYFAHDLIQHITYVKTMLTMSTSRLCWSMSCEAPPMGQVNSLYWSQAGVLLLVPRCPTPAGVGTP